ncbi:putative leucine-rich repeat domain superfamily, F-box-like domain superfamily [Helianthus debilis subsp. tardiflorus]
MNLHSKEVAIKRPKPPNLDETDFISKLHDSLLLQILYLLPEFDAARTRILSNRWKNLCSFLPNLHLVMPFCSNIEQVNKFHDSVNQTLALRAGFRSLDIRFPNDRFRFTFCWDLFRTCGSLVWLTLRGGFVITVSDVDVLFPCLKSISLVSIVYLRDVCFKNLISGCPVLEELYVERQLIGELDDMESCMVISPSLKRLRLSFALSGRGDFRVVIDAPRLEYLSIMDVMSTRYLLLTEPLSLTEAHLRVSTYDGDEHVAQLVRCLSNVKVLMLNVPTLRVCVCIYFDSLISLRF